MNGDQLPGGRDARVLRERQLSNPFTFSRRVALNGVFGTPELFDLFFSEPGYDTVIDVFRVMFPDVFGTADLFRAGLLSSQRLVDGYKESSFNDDILTSIPDLFQAPQIANGMIPCLMINFSPSRHRSYYRIKAASQITCKIENYGSPLADVPANATIFISGGQVTP